MTRFLLVFSLFCTLLITSCQSSASDKSRDDAATTAQIRCRSAAQNVIRYTMVCRIHGAWPGFLTDRLLVTEKAGEILIFKDGKNTGEKLSGVPAVVSEGQGGLLDIKLHPDYANNKWIYISYSKPVKGGATTAITVLNLMEITSLKNRICSKQSRTSMPTSISAAVSVFDKDNYMFFQRGRKRHDEENVGNQ